VLLQDPFRGGVPFHNDKGHYGKGSSPRFVKFSSGPNTNSECSNLLNSLTNHMISGKFQKKINHNLPMGGSNVASLIRVGFLFGFSWVFD